MIESQNRQNKITSPQKNIEDKGQEVNLRPESFSDFIDKHRLVPLGEKVPGFFPLSILNDRLLSESRIEKIPFSS